MQETPQVHCNFQNHLAGLEMSLRTKVLFDSIYSHGVTGICEKSILNFFAQMSEHLCDLITLEVKIYTHLKINL